MKTKDDLPDCPVATTVQLIGNKWKLLILRNLLARPRRFNELRRDLDGISQKVLTESLRSLEEDGIVTVRTRTVLASPLHAGDETSIFAASDSVRRVVVNGRVAWDDGWPISPRTAAIWETAHSYVGDASANNATAQALELGAALGPWENELETDRAPYGWILTLQTPVDASYRARREQKMDELACVMLALIGNLDRVTFRYTVDGAPCERCVTTQQAEQRCGVKLKACADSPAALEALLQNLGW